MRLKWRTRVNDSRDGLGDLPDTLLASSVAKQWNTMSSHDPHGDVVAWLPAPAPGWKYILEIDVANRHVVRAVPIGRAPTSDSLVSPAALAASIFHQSSQR
jgi:hypothetical protein